MPVRQVSSALMQTSPSPCTPWPSPAEKFAPGTKTGRNSVAPAPSSLLSRLPPCARGSLVEIAPHSGGGATPMTPKKGASGSSVPQGRRQVRRRAVDRDVAEVALGEVLGQGADQRAEAAKAPVGAELDPVDVDSSMSPGSAPSTATGPVRMWPPGARHSAAWMAASAGGTARPEPGGGITSGAGGDALQHHRIAGVDGEHRRDRRRRKCPSGRSAGVGARRCVAMQSTPRV